MGTVVSTINNGADDTEYYVTGTTFSASGSTLRAYKTSSAQYATTFRFANITIPQGASVYNATLKVYPYNNDCLSNLNLVIEANDVDDAIAPTSSGEFSVLALTSTYMVTTTNASSWNSARNSSTYYIIYDSGITGNLRSVIQEVINRPGWTSGNALQLKLSYAVTSSETRRMYSYDAGASYAAVLTLWFTESLTVPGQLTTSGMELHGSLADQSDGSISSAGSVLTSGNVTGNLSSHAQSFSTPLVIVTMAASHGSLLLSDLADTFAMNSGGTIGLEDSPDAFAFEAYLGASGALTLQDEPDTMDSLPGGGIALSDAQDALSLAGLAATTAICSFSDQSDTWDVQALSGVVATVSPVDASDLLVLTGQPETTGGIDLSEFSDTITMTALCGGLADAISLTDLRDSFAFSGTVTESGLMALLDLPDLMALSGMRTNPFASHVIQYQKARY